jgi:superfamily I DNA and/or RNA helicase
LQKLLKTYLRRLTNLTSRNRSLLLLNLPQEQFLDLHSLNFLDNKPSFDYIHQLISQKNQIPLCDVQDSRFDKVNEISQRLRKLARTESFIEEERGAKDLYVAYPFIKGKMSDGTAVRCPLLFFPVTLKNNGKKWILEQRDEPESLNRSFLLAYSYFNQIKLPDEWLEKSFEDFDKDSLAFRTQLYELLKDSPFEINFNQELFTNQLIDFEKLAKSELDSSERNGELKLYPQAVLGIFPQAGSYLVPDYEQLIENAEEGHYELDTFEELFQHATPPTNQPLFKEETAFLPFAIDASQEAAIKQVKEGYSIVVQGPPGTGKSQLIANLIADFTARGKKVLVVCQKRVALDTVYQRLQKVMMTDFVALIHDFKNDRKALFEKIAGQIERIEDFQKKNKGLDAIFLERNFTQISRRIDKISEELQSLKEALFDESVCGTSVKELYLSSSLNKAYIDLQDVYRSFPFHESAEFEGRLSRYLQYETKLRTGAGYEFWQLRNSFSKKTFTDLAKITDTIEAVIAFQRKNGVLFSIIELNQFDENTVQTFIKYFENAQVGEIFKAIVQEKKFISNRQFDLEKIYTELEQLFTQDGIEQSIPARDLLFRKTQVEKAHSASQSGVNSLVWKFFSKDKRDIEILLAQNRLPLSEAGLGLLNKRIQQRIVFEDIKEKLNKKEIIIDEKDNWETIKTHLQNYILANKAYTIYQQEEFIRRQTTDVLNDSKPFSVNSFKDLAKLIVETKLEFVQWQLYLSYPQIEKLVNTPEAKHELIAYLKQNFDLLVEADELKESFNSTELEVIQRLLNYENPEVSTEDLTAVFLNSLRIAWTQHIETLYPILRGVSSLKIEQLEVELQECVLKKQELSQEILLLKLREQTYKDLVINRLQNVVTYRELQHQTTKKRKLWSVRKLLENHSEEIFKLIPCWMASPESVSAIFPLSGQNPADSLFDLVIFDEASQCFAENGIPAIYRGKQVVIAGDSKQLQPTDLYQIRYDEDAEDEAVLEIDSLLDLAAQYLPQSWLRGHYRSHSLDLIDFSNQHFYKNSLQLLPHFAEISKNKPAISYIKLDGFWENNTNPTEAQKVLEIVEDLKHKAPTKTIGVVTFNFKQADLIYQTISPVLGEGWGVIKNIENIQGDEYDIVIFSVGYAPNMKGKLLMNFGSLNQQGGENRLNVAITRAREFIHIVSSILPHQLQVEQSQNQGPKLLKKYLEYALEVSQGDYTPEPYTTEKFNTRWLLKNQLVRENIGFHLELPFADITVKEADTYESLILTDDDLYYESISPKDAHAYLPISLRAKGWKFERLWSRNTE